MAESAHNLGQVGSSILPTAVSYLCAELCSSLLVPFHVTTQQFQPTARQERADAPTQIDDGLYHLAADAISPELLCQHCSLVPARAGHCLHCHKKSLDKLFIKNFFACIVLNNIGFTLTRGSVVYARGVYSSTIQKPNAS